jgi:hypothetical protein
VLSSFEPNDDAELIVGRAADAVETLDAEGERTQASTTESRARNRERPTAGLSL